MFDGDWMWVACHLAHHDIDLFHDVDRAREAVADYYAAFPHYLHGAWRPAPAGHDAYGFDGAQPGSVQVYVSSYGEVLASLALLPVT